MYWITANAMKLPKIRNNRCNYYGLDWIGLDWIGLDWIGLILLLFFFVINSYILLVWRINS